MGNQQLGAVGGTVDDRATDGIVDAVLMPLKLKYRLRKLGWNGSSKRASNSGREKKVKNRQGRGPRRRQGPGAWDALPW